MAKKPPNWYTFQNAEKGKPASLTIEGEIGDWGVSSAGFRASMARLGEGEALSLHICSGGGSIFAGQEIANIIRGHKGEVSVTLGSIVASIATVIACAGKTVTAAKNTVYMIHRASGYAGGNADDMRKTAEIMETLEKGIVAAYVDKTGMKADDLAEMMDDETWMDAEEALSHGFIDAIGDEDAEDEVIDNVDLSNYRNSAPLLSLLHLGGAEPAFSTAGNSRRLTLQAIRNAATPPVPPPEKPPAISQEKTVKTAEEIEAEKKANEAAIREGIKAALTAKKVRDKEILATVELVKKRDKKDFSALAADFIEREQDNSAFCVAMMNSETFTPVVGVVGSGIQSVTEPLDRYKGTPGFAFVNSEGFRAMAEQVKRHGPHIQNLSIRAELPDFWNVQTSIATSGSGLTSIEKWPEVIQLGVRPLTVEDLVTGGQTTNTTFRYIQEVTFTEAATSVAITGADETLTPLPAVAVTYTEKDAPVVDMGGYIAASENVLTDYPGIASLINMRLPYQVDRDVEDNILNGDGTGTNMTGILQTAGIQTLALGANTRMDGTLKLQTLVRWQAMTAGQAQGGFEPDAYLVHPTDWETLVLTKDANGQYLCRGPFTGAYGQPAEQGSVGSIVEFYTLWGKKVVISPVIAQGTILCGAWKQGAMKLDRQGLMIEMTNSNGTDFLYRKITLRGTRRAALAVIRPGNFAQLTGV